MTDLAEFVAEALKAMDLVKSEQSLLGWHDLYFGSTEYLQVGKEEALKLEEAYQRKAAWLMGVGAG